jgi:hypothetical protein
MLSPFQLRLYSTIILLPLLKYLNVSLVLPVASLFLLDYLDCVFYNKFISKYECKRGENNINYHVNDKILDLTTYFLFMFLFWDKFDDKNKSIILVLLIWRTIGVLIFTKTKNKNYLKVFFDGINGVLVLYLLSNYSSFVKDNYNLLIPFVLILKIIFELYNHR